jgi:hypothetical protein
MRATVQDQDWFDGQKEKNTTPAFAWRPVSQPCHLPKGRHLLLWVDACPYTLNRPEIHMGHVIADGRVRFLDPRINLDKNMQPAAWAEMPAGPGEASESTAPCVFHWHDAAAEPLPENVALLIVESGGSHRIVSLDQSGYLFADSGENLDPENVVAWAYIPHAPRARAKEGEG